MTLASGSFFAGWWHEEICVKKVLENNYLYNVPGLCLSHNNRSSLNGSCLLFPITSIILASSGKGTNLLTRLIAAIAFTCNK